MKRVGKKAAQGVIVFQRQLADLPGSGARRVEWPPHPGAKRPKGGLFFHSQFECGNLGRAVYVGRNEFDLLMCDDFNTRGHTQWYYFSVCNATPHQEYIFNLVNFEKPSSLYNQGA